MKSQFARSIYLWSGNAGIKIVIEAETEKKWTNGIWLDFYWSISRQTETHRGVDQSIRSLSIFFFMIFFSAHHWAHRERNKWSSMSSDSCCATVMADEENFYGGFIRLAILFVPTVSSEHWALHDVFIALRALRVWPVGITFVNENEFWLLILCRKSQFHSSVEGVIFQRRRKPWIGRKSPFLLRLLADGVTADASLFIRNRSTLGLPVTCHSTGRQAGNENHLEKRN